MAEVLARQVHAQRYLTMLAIRSNGQRQRDESSPLAREECAAEEDNKGAGAGLDRTLRRTGRTGQRLLRPMHDITSQRVAAA
jgi:hypothetical protein